MRNRLLFLAVLAATLGAQAPAPRPVNPDAARALWRSIKKQLTAANGEDYFRANLENADLPVLIGTLLSATPADQPSELLVNLSGGDSPEVTLKLTDESGRLSQVGHLNGPLAPGSQIQFRGVPVAFTREPFMLTFEVPVIPPRAAQH